MQAIFFNVTDVPMTEDRRKCSRFTIDCPVRVLTPGRGKKRLIGEGLLHDIGEKGARFILDRSLDEGKRISLEVDFRNPDGEVTTIRFRGIVRRVEQGQVSEIAVFFLKGESYIRGKKPSKASEDSLWTRFTAGNHWVN